VRPRGPRAGNRAGDHALQGSRRAGEGVRGSGRGDARHRDVQAEGVRPPPDARLVVSVHDARVLPAGLPVPVDDGATAHLPGAAVPGIVLPATSGRRVALDQLASAPGVLFFYPRTGEAGRPAGPEWDAIPGARGCTPQSCGFRDLHTEFTARGVRIAAVSTQ